MNMHRSFSLYLFICPWCVQEKNDLKSQRYKVKNGSKYDWLIDLVLVPCQIVWGNFMLRKEWHSLPIHIYILVLLLPNIFLAFWHIVVISSIPILNESIWAIDGTLTGTTTLGYCGPGSNGNEGVLNTTQISRTGALPSDAV